MAKPRGQMHVEATRRDAFIVLYLHLLTCQGTCPEFAFVSGKSFEHLFFAASLRNASVNSENDWHLFQEETIRVQITDLQGIPLGNPGCKAYVKLVWSQDKTQVSSGTYTPQHRDRILLSKPSF